MSDWLRPVRAAVAETGSTRWFFRDDDAGWDDARLMALVDVFRAGEVHIDLAAIPAATSRSLGRQLLRLVDEGWVSVHQHGWTHANHEVQGRKCEFGASRTLAEQHRDLMHGRLLLSDRVEGRLQPFFTPPWNRCTDVTALLLTHLGYVCLSADVSAPRRGLSELIEIPVAVDWSRSWRDGGRKHLAQDLMRAVASASAIGDRAAPGIGVMLHHAVMSVDERSAAGELLALLQRDPAASLTSIAALADEDTFTVVSSTRHGGETAFRQAPLKNAEGWNRQ